MTATLLVLTALALIAAGLSLLLARRLWFIALPAAILGLLVVVAEGPRAAAELWGERVDGIIAATRESLRLETTRPSGTRVSHDSVQHRFGAIVCYRSAGNPGIGAGAPIDPAIKAAIGEAPTAMDVLCQKAPGSLVLRQTEVRLDESAHDAETPGRLVTLLLLRPFGLLEWAWPVDAPLLPMLPRPWAGPGRGSTGATQTLTAEVVSITIDTKGRSPISRRAQDYAIPVAHVRLRYAPAGLPTPVEGIDSIDAPSMAQLTPGARIAITVAPGAPRQPAIVGATRGHWWRNPASEILALAGVIAVVVVAWVLWRRRGRSR